MKVLTACLAFSLFVFGFLPAQAQTDPIQAAKSAGLYGVTPDLGRDLGIPLSQLGQKVAWERFGIYFEEHKFTAFVASLDPNGAAAQQGAKVGDVLRGSDIMGANKSLNGILQAFAALADRESAALLLYVFDADSGWQREYTLTAAAPGEQAATVPPALRGAATSHKGLMAIVRSDPSLSDPRDITHDAMLALQAISRHVKGCAGPNAVEIPVQIATTTTTRDGFGTIKNTETTQYTEALRVRPEFAGWARANIRAYPPQPISTVRSAVLDLIAQEGCDGAGFKQLEMGLAKVIGVSLPEPVAPQQAESGSIPATADGFVAQCFDPQKDGYVARGLTIDDRSVAQICFCMEHAAREMGDAGLYNDLQVSDTRQLETDPGLRARFQPVFDQCFQAAPGSELRSRVEALWREMNI